jgi:hypothetical protein
MEMKEYLLIIYKRLEDLTDRSYLESPKLLDYKGNIEIN